MNRTDMTRIKEVGKKTVADFVCSETGSVGVKNAAAVGAMAAALALSEAPTEAVTISILGDLIVAI